MLPVEALELGVDIDCRIGVEAVDAHQRCGTDSLEYILLDVHGCKLNENMFKNT